MVTPVLMNYGQKTSVIYMNYECIAYQLMVFSASSVLHVYSVTTEIQKDSLSMNHFRDGIKMKEKAKDHELPPVISQNS